MCVQYEPAVRTGWTCSIEDDEKLADWISETSSNNYRSTIKGKFKAKGL